MATLQQSYLQGIYRPIIWVFVGLAVIILGIAGYTGCSNTVISLVPRPKLVTIQKTFLVSPNQVEGQPWINGQVSLTEEQATVVVPASTNSQQVPGRARGTVTFSNTTTRDQPLVAGTRLAATNSLIFRTVSRVNIPARGTVEAEVQADVEGAAGDVEPGRFTIVALQPATQSLIYATSAKKFTGGTIAQSGTLSVDDLTAASNQAREEIRARVGATEPGKIINLEPLSVVTEPAADIPSSQYRVIVKMRVQKTVYDQPDLDRQLNDLLLAALPVDLALVAIESPVVVPTEQPASNSIVIDVASRGYGIVTTAAAWLQPGVFIGLNRTEIMTALLGTNLVERAEGKFSPWWRQTAPDRPDRITIDLSSQPAR